MGQKTWDPHWKVEFSSNITIPTNRQREEGPRSLVLTRSLYTVDVVILSSAPPHMRLFGQYVAPFYSLNLTTPPYPLGPPCTHRLTPSLCTDFHAACITCVPQHEREITWVWHSYPNPKSTRASVARHVIMVGLTHWWAFVRTFVCCMMIISHLTSWINHQLKGVSLYTHHDFPMMG